MKIDSQFLKEFDLFFNVDLIKFDDKRQMLSDAALLGDMANTWPQSQELDDQLTSILDSRSTDEVMQFIRTTQVDWLADEVTTNLLYEILGVVRNRLKAKI